VGADAYCGEVVGESEAVPVPVSSEGTEGRTNKTTSSVCACLRASDRYASLCSLCRITRIVNIILECEREQLMNAA
jgi:hypothetical protein